MRDITQQNMINAFGGESMAHMRYLIFAERAAHEDLPNVARLFRAIAAAELVHAGDHYRALRHLDGGFAANSMGTFGPGETNKNLALAVAGEDYEVQEMYPAFLNVAELQGETEAYRSFLWSYETEKMHLALFRKAQEAVASKRDVELGPVAVCAVCGYTLEGEAPDECPVCKAKRDKFKIFN